LGTFRHNWISPFSFRKKLANSIKSEIEEHSKNGSGRIWIKLNNLVDADVCKMLMKAVIAGVSVKIIVRSSCAMYMMAEYPNLEIISIIDQYLEHARVFIFGTGKRKKTYISSADLMERNLDARIEVGTPILDKAIANQIEHILQIQLHDNQSARYIDEAMSNAFKEGNSTEKINAQKEIYSYIRSLK
jgi:polyphosphate kinase